MHLIIAFIVMLIAFQVIGAVATVVLELFSETGPVGCLVALGILAFVVLLFAH